MHKGIANDIIAFLHEAFPDASIALAGSVSYGTNKKDSDIDILFLQEKINNSYNISYHHKGIRISIFIYNKKFLRQNDSKYMQEYFITPISLIFRSQIIYDPNFLISELKEYILNFLVRRRLLKECIIENLKAKIQELLQINALHNIERKEISYHIIYLLTNIFYLKEFSGKINIKEENSNPFLLIKTMDVKLYNILISCIPYHNETYYNLTKAYYHITNY